ncbi:VOC family protein [Nocardia rhamnosiphila]|uniref:VOC family protein n=1 Tax=Nocardia rhamnosiphila TaxID=426716 RepID=UPI0033FCE6D7
MVLQVKFGNLAFDCINIDVMVRFWGGFLGMDVTFRKDTWADLEPLGAEGPILSFQKVPELKAGKNRLHLDIEVSDIQVAGEVVASLGASPLGDPKLGGEMDFRVWSDPEGNEFCLVKKHV